MTAPATVAYLDCFSGISGDMLLGALLHAGLEENTLLEELEKIPGLDFQLTVSDELCSGISCKQVTVVSPGRQQFRHLHDILTLLDNSGLSLPTREKCGKIFTRLAEAEAKVHNVPLEKIHFHEVGAVDTLVDIVGTVVGMQHLHIDQLICSPLPMGHGFVHCAHGRLPLPAPAVCELLHNVPVYGTEQTQELVTPTGAAIAVSLADTFSSMPAMILSHCGYGAGKHILTDRQPNLLRLLVGTIVSHNESHDVEIIETNLDDWNSETFPHLCALLFKQQALDVSLSPLIMKKGRPGHLLRVITDPVHSLPLKQTILTETTAIGLRFRTEKRMALAREMVTVNTPWGEVAAKKVQTPAGAVIYPEYEVCRRIAEKNEIPLSRVYREVTCAEEKKNG